MIQIDEFIGRWKWKELKQSNKEIVETLRISSESKEFLVKAGLPSETSSIESFKFSLDTETFPYLTEIIEKTIVPEEFSEMRKIGTSSFSYICVDELTNGHIFIYFQKLNRRQFVNSNIQSLAECLLISLELFDMFEKNEKNYQKEEDRNFARNWYKEKINLIDPLALDNESNMWMEVISDID